MNNQRILQIKKNRQGIPTLKIKGGNGVAESDSEVSEELIVQFNDAANKTEYNEVPLTRRSIPFMDSFVVSSKGVIVTQRLESFKSVKT